MRIPSKIVALALGLLIGVAAAGMWPATAHADVASSAICNGLDHHHAGGIQATVTILLNNGATMEQAEQYVYDTVATYCPRNMGRLESMGSLESWI